VRELNDQVAKEVSGFTYVELNEKFSDYAVKAAKSKWRGGGLPVTTKMLTPREAADQPHWRERQAFVNVEHPRFGSFSLPMAGKLSDTPFRVKWVSVDVGEDNAYVSEKYGLRLNGHRAGSREDK
jgi:crotonobetainyl-CoA:carnitine CoA-transferase CaiB-like acyl-CoA transferase